MSARTCNRCGHAVPDGQYCAKIEYAGGYYSEPMKSGIGDGDEFKFYLCEICLGRLMRACKIPPEFSTFHGGAGVEWRGKSLKLMRKIYGEK